MDKIKVKWTRACLDNAGNAFGYETHNRMMKEHCAKYFEYSDDAEIVININPADFFKREEGKFNILFTMWESLDLPNSYLRGISRADALVVPCSFCRDLFKDHFEGKIDVCHEGVDPNRFKFVERQFPRPWEKFRFLWVGAPNPRKGYPLLLEFIKAMEMAPDKFKDVEVYMKSSATRVTREEYLLKLWRSRKRVRSQQGKEVFSDLFKERKKVTEQKDVERFGKYNNIVMDWRKLPIDELVGLYGSAHCFVLPSLGEGWGLTLSEAMATGAPCISISETGCKDFFDRDVGYPILTSHVDSDFANYDLKGRVFMPDANDMARNMFHVFQNYGEALSKGRKASNRMHSKFTWEQSARRLFDIVKNHKLQKVGK